MRILLLCLSLFLSGMRTAAAIDPGIARGSMQLGGATIPLRHAYAHLHDNAERVLEPRRELRIALVDREVPQESLAGIAFLPIERLAREDKVRGVLLRFDPDRPGRVLVTPLVTLPPSGAQESLATHTVSESQQDAVRNLRIANNRVRGKFDGKNGMVLDSPGRARLDYRVEFSAPLFTEQAVTADLKGKAAQESQQARVLRDRSRAPVQRVVVRGNRAVVIFSNKEWGSLVREGGDWRPQD